MFKINLAWPITSHYICGHFLIKTPHSPLVFLNICAWRGGHCTQPPSCSLCAIVDKSITALQQLFLGNSHMLHTHRQDIIPNINTRGPCLLRQAKVKINFTELQSILCYVGWGSETPEAILSCRKITLLVSEMYLLYS